MDRTTELLEQLQFICAKLLEFNIKIININIDSNVCDIF